MQTRPIWLIAICSECHVTTDGLQRPPMDVILLVNPHWIQSNHGLLRSKFPVGVEGQCEVNLPSASSSLQPKIFLWRSPCYPGSFCSPQIWKCCRMPLGCLVDSLLSCLPGEPRTITMSKETMTSGSPVRREGPGVPHTAGRSLCGSGLSSSRDWQGSGFIAPSTVQVLN